MSHPVEDDQRLILKGCEYGLDVVALVGERYFRGRRSLLEVHSELTDEHGVLISERHVPNLFRLYLAMVGARNLRSQTVRARLEKQGRLILAVDAVQFDDVSPALYVVREVLSEEILVAERIEKADVPNVAQFLAKVKGIGLPIAGIVTDKQHALVAAVAEVFPDVPHQLCHTHYLGNLVKPMESDLAKLSSAVEKAATEVRELENRLDRAKAASPEERKLSRDLCRGVRAISKCSGDKLLDPPPLKRFRRLRELQELTQEAVRNKGGEWPLLSRLLMVLGMALSPWTELAGRLLQQVEAVRMIARVLKQDAPGAEIKRQLDDFLAKLDQEAPRRGRGAARGHFYDHVILVSLRFMQGLFASYDVPGLPRTNNDLEGFFGTLKWHERRIRGRKSTKGGPLESFAPYLLHLWSEVHQRRNLQALLQDLPPDEVWRARQELEELGEPARERRSFLRDPKAHLEQALSAWLTTDSAPQRT